MFLRSFNLILIPIIYHVNFYHLSIYVKSYHLSPSCNPRVIHGPILQSFQLPGWISLWDSAELYPAMVTQISQPRKITKNGSYHPQMVSVCAFWGRAVTALFISEVGPSVSLSPVPWIPLLDASKGRLAAGGIGKLVQGAHGASIFKGRQPQQQGDKDLEVAPVLQLVTDIMGIS